MASSFDVLDRGLLAIPLLLWIVGSLRFSDLGRLVRSSRSNDPSLISPLSGVSLLFCRAHPPFLCPEVAEAAQAVI